MADRALVLIWENRHAAFGDILMRLRERGKFTDVTLVCEGKFYPVHKLVLSACSEHLEKILENNQCHHPTIVLHGIKCYDLEQLLMYMYTGEVSVPQRLLSQLMQAAELLEIKGLAVPDNAPAANIVNENKKKKSSSERNVSPPCKRRKHKDQNSNLEGTGQAWNSPLPEKSKEKSPSPDSKQQRYKDRSNNQGKDGQEVCTSSLTSISSKHPPEGQEDVEHSPLRNSQQPEVGREETDDVEILVKEEVEENYSPDSIAPPDLMCQAGNDGINTSPAFLMDDGSILVDTWSIYDVEQTQDHSSLQSHHQHHSIKNKQSQKQMEELKLRIAEILPALTSVVVKDVCEHLTNELGVKSIEDLKYIKEDDLPMLKLIQVRKLIKNWKEDNDNTPCNRTQETVTSPSCTTTPSSFSNLATYNKCWATDFAIPTKKFPKEELLALEKGNRPSPSGRHEIIRILCSEVAIVCQRPRKKALSIIAQKIVHAYPNSFADIFDGTKIGTGHDSVLKQLQGRFDNMNRQTHGIKRKLLDDYNGTAGAIARKHMMDEYGCINFMPLKYPDTETKCQLNEKKLILKDKMLLRECEQVESLLQETYILQRINIIDDKMPINELKEQWPHLFKATGMFIHFCKLTGIKIRDKIEMSLENKRKKLMAWMGEQENKKIKRILLDLIETKVDLKNVNPELPAFIQAIMAHFQEKEESLCLLVESSATKEKCERILPQTPCLIAFGESWLTSTRFILGVYGTVVCDHIPNFLVGLAMMFASYYNFNICYPLEAAATLEFIQRGLVGMNPDNGSKIQIKKNRKRHCTIHPKVLSFFNRVVDIE
ncbi:hypothetical protein Pmani_011468 [Petrolisthes manimaculis]|uniref:BTB domain-containing protein n=1 Tax=Petrolisthes manimaculis TaxID=1843537 RepID=A0AAE1Q2F2_9EUCA|nr:hypothetical protein Pmani_011468 [Petrolisthes manimaculis]